MSALIGQDRVLSVMKDLLMGERVPTSFMISGPRGSGKKTLACVWAQALNCEIGRFHEDCGCGACRRTKDNVHPDVRWFGLDEEAYSIKIDEIHQLIHWAGFHPLEGNRKVFVFNGAERMTEEAQNALLKTLEEPPPDSVILLLTENPALLKPTLASRCFAIKMQPLPCELIRKILRERYQWSEEEASKAARFSRGRLGVALELKDQNMKEARGNLLREIVAQPVEGLERWVGKKRVEVLKAIEFLELLIRDLLVYRETRDAQLLYLEPSDADFEHWSRSLPADILLSWLALLEETRAALEDNVNPKIALFRLGTSVKDLYEENLLSHHPALLR